MCGVFTLGIKTLRLQTIHNLVIKYLASGKASLKRVRKFAVHHEYTSKKPLRPVSQTLFQRIITLLQRMAQATFVFSPTSLGPKISKHVMQRAPAETGRGTGKYLELVVQQKINEHAAERHGQVCCLGSKASWVV